MTQTTTEDAAAERFIQRYDAGAARLIRAVSLGGATGERIEQLLVSLTDGGPGPDMGRLIGNADQENVAAIVAVIKGQALLGVHPALDRWRMERAMKGHEGKEGPGT
jgi:hypothetical protein